MTTLPSVGAPLCGPATDGRRQRRLSIVSAPYAKTGPARWCDAGRARAQVCALQWSRHEREILSSHGFSQNQLCLWRYPSMAKVAEMSGHTSRVLHLAQSPDGTSVVSAAADETLRFWKCFAEAAPATKARARPARLAGRPAGLLASGVRRLLGDTRDRPTHDALTAHAAKQCKQVRTARPAARQQTGFTRMAAQPAGRAWLKAKRWARAQAKSAAAVGSSSRSILRSINIR